MSDPTTPATNQNWISFLLNGLNTVVPSQQQSNLDVETNNQTGLENTLGFLGINAEQLKADIVKYGILAIVVVILIFIMIVSAKELIDD